MNEVDKLYSDYNKLLYKWTKEITILKRQLNNSKLTEIKKAYIRGQIKALEVMCERFNSDFFI
jgi:hypothetical protein